MNSRWTIVAAGAAAAAVLSLQASTAAQGPLRPLRSEARVDRGIVAAGRSFVADAGAQMLTSGGNAIDAGVASIFASAVVEISHFGLGGEAPIIIYSARDTRVIVINGQRPAPKAAAPSMFAGKTTIPGNGPLGATIPAAVDAAALALEKYGTRSLAAADATHTIVEAIKLACADRDRCYADPVERTFAPGVIDEPRARGHALRLRGPYGISTGVVAAGVDPGTGRLRGAADPCRERAPVAF